MRSFVSVVESKGYREENHVMRQEFVLLLGMFLGSCGAAAQTPAPQIVLPQEHIAPVITTLRTVSIPLPAASFLRSQDPGESPAHYSLLFAGAYERGDGLAKKEDNFAEEVAKMAGG